MIEIYRENKAWELKTPKIKTTHNELIFVDNEGNKVSEILVFAHNEMSVNCKMNLECRGYRTDFAEWDGDRLVRFLEIIK